MNIGISERAVFGTVVAGFALSAHASVRVDVAASCTTSGSCAGCGDTWANAYYDLQEAIDCAQVGDEVWVAAGTYAQGAPILLRDGVKVYGGFDKAETAASQSDPFVNITTLDGGGAHTVVKSVNNDGTAVLRGFHITNGVGGTDFDDAGGVWVANSSPMIVNCVIEDNHTGWLGGGVSVLRETSHPKFVNCIIRHNGNVYDSQGELVTEAIAGAGIFINRAAPTFTNCLIHDNRAAQGAGVASLTDFGADTPTFQNCTISQNAATYASGRSTSGGISCGPYACVTLTNSILWGNTDAGGDESPNLDDLGHHSKITYTDIEGWWFAIGNIDADPLFLDPANGDFRISLSSPCKNTGRYHILPPDIADLDWDGDTTEPLPKDLGLGARRMFYRLDMGAYEARFTDRKIGRAHV